MHDKTFGVVQKHKRITIFKVSGRWIFKNYFEDKEIFRELADHYDKDNYRFEFKTIGVRNNSLKLMEKRVSREN